MAAYKLTWVAPSVGGSASISGYDVLYTPAGGSQTVVPTGSTATTHILTGLSDGVVYSFQVRVSGSGKPLSSVVVSHNPPAQVSGLSVTATGNGTIDLSWTAPSSDMSITDYSVEYTPSGGSATTVLVGSAATTYQLTGLTNGTQYSVRVAAVSAAGTGAYSTAVTGTPAATSTTAVLLNYNNSLIDSGPTGYTFTGGIGASFDAVNTKFGSHSRAFPLYTSDGNSGSHWQLLFTGDFTVEMFWRYNSGVLGNTAYAAGAWGLFDSSGSNYDGCAIFADAYSSNAIGWYWYLGGSGSSGTIYSSTPLIDDGTFRHVAIVREGTEFRLYYDGSLIASNTQANNNAPFISTSHDLKVGIDPYMMGYDGTDGNIDDFRISSSALYSGPTYTIPTAELT